MCTVTYIPKGKDHFIFTSNRDEAPKRSSNEIVTLKKQNKTLLFPKDQLANGTWIAISDHNQLVCILNGAFEKHKHRPPYRLSRGIMALDFFDYPSAENFFNHYDFQGIEPFTMVIFDNGQLFDFRWDESQKHIQPLDITQKHIWSSCTLYPKNWQEKRVQWFDQWLQDQKEISQTSILDFHKNGGEGNSEYDLVMNRYNIVRTVSITSIDKQPNNAKLSFLDLLESKNTTKDLLFTTNLNPI